MIPTTSIPLVGEVCRGQIVTLSWPDDTDYDCLTALRNRPSTRRWFLDDREISLEESRQWIRQLNRPHDALLVVRHSGCGVFLGSIGWANLDSHKRTATFGRLAIDGPGLRRVARFNSVASAIAVDAATALRDFAFIEMGLRALDTWYAVDNVLAARVNAAVGMVVTGPDSLMRPDGQTFHIMRAVLTRMRWLEVRGDACGR